MLTATAGITKENRNCLPRMFAAGAQGKQPPNHGVLEHRGCLQPGNDGKPQPLLFSGYLQPECLNRRLLVILQSCPTPNSLVTGTGHVCWIMKWSWIWVVTTALTIMCVNMNVKDKSLGSSKFASLEFPFAFLLLSTWFLFPLFFCCLFFSPFPCCF